MNRIPSCALPRARRAHRLRALWLLGGWCLVAMGGTSTGAAEIYFPRPEPDRPITVRSDWSTRWRQGGLDVWYLRGECSIEQGETVVRSSEAMIWVKTPAPDDPSRTTRVMAYLEGGEGRPVMLEERQAGGKQEIGSWFGRFSSSAGLDWRVPQPGTASDAMPPIYDRGLPHVLGDLEPDLSPEGDQPQADSPAPLMTTTGISEKISGTNSDGRVSPVQFQQFAPPPPLIPAPDPGPANSVRRIHISPRSDVSLQLESRPQGDETVLVLSGGVNVLVEGIQIEGVPSVLGRVDTVDLEADRVVLWTAGNIASSTQFEQSGDTPLEIYMEGNIVFRQGDRTVYADRMYYDARRRVGVVLNAELLTPLPEIEGYHYPGLVRLKARILQMLDDSRFVGHDALFTTSRLEEPSYSLEAEMITLEDRQQVVIDPYTGMPAIDTLTGAPIIEHERLARSQNNFLYVGGIPVFYWPTIATNLEQPRFYITDLRLRNDNIYGNQVLLGLDMYQLLGADAPPGTEWDLSLDYLGKRGFGYGTSYDYLWDSFWGVPGPTVGFFDFWAINDRGVDNLGRGRRDIDPEKSYRGRAFWNHRQKFIDGPFQDWALQAEVGWISDRTFLEQYYEPEWDQNKDQLTGVRLKRLYDNHSFSIEANVRLNDFFTQTQWLPRLDHYMLGQDLLGETLTWHAHSQAAYANIGVATTPSNPTLASQFALLPWEQTSTGDRISGNGERFATRQEIDLPINASPFKIVPYVLGEAAHWGADREGDDIQRLYVQTGVRASIPFWAVNPEVRDPLFNLNGLAHKVVFDAELSFADANQSYTEFPLYDEIDDDAIEEFRRRLFFPPFGGALAGQYYDPTTTPNTIDQKFDPRFYLIRSGIQGWVAAPTTELVEDLAALRLGMRHRLQTKRGGIGRQHIIDWLTLDTNITYFPREDRDNLGQELGLADYDLQWHLGDRFTFVSDGAADFFGDGLRTVSGGVVINRPTRGNAYLGYRTIRGPFTADVLLASVNYRLGPKWVASASATVDFSEAGNIGQSLAFSRIGESLIVTVGGNVDESKDNVGISLLVEPRFLPRTSVSRRTGIEIPPVGYYGLE